MDFLSPPFLIALFIDVCCAGTLILELWTGIAVVGWAGNSSTVNRQKDPGPYWVSIGVQIFIIFALSAAVVSD